MKHFFEKYKFVYSISDFACHISNSFLNLFTLVPKLFLKLVLSLRITSTHGKFISRNEYIITMVKIVSMLINYLTVLNYV